MITAPQSLSTGLGKPERETFLQKLSRTRYFSVSLFLHILALAVFGTIILERASEDPAAFVSDGDLFVPTDSLPSMEEDRPPEKAPEPPGGEPQETKVTLPSMSTLTTLATNQSFSLPSTPLTTGLRPNLGTGGPGQNGGPGGTGKGKGLAGTGGFKMFGTVTKNVQNVVLVLDVSSSMVNGKKNEKTYAVLEHEACNVIRSLKEENKFGVVVFSQEAKVYQDHLVKGHGDEKARAVSWLKQMSPMATKDPRAEDEVKNFHHGTRADLGLKAAFDMQPDVIFFVSDGEPTGTTVPAILAQVQKAQAEGAKFIAIHSIAYLADDGQQFMKDLAAQNQGTFREVNPRDVK